MPLERDINIAINGLFWVEVANPEHPFTAMLISRSRHMPHCLHIPAIAVVCIYDDEVGVEGGLEVAPPHELLLVLGGIINININLLYIKSILILL